jgi:hypothetical protein
VTFNVPTASSRTCRIDLACDPAHLAYGNFNGDGKLDLICNSDYLSGAAPSDGHIIAFSQGDGTFASPGWLFNNWCDPPHLGYGDFDGDGKTDLICNEDNGLHTVAFSNGDGTFHSPGGLFNGWCDPAHLAYGDFNGDGKLDLICNADNGAHIIAFSQGDGTFTSAGWWELPPSPPTEPPPPPPPPPPPMGQLTINVGCNNTGGGPGDVSLTDDSGKGLGGCSCTTGFARSCPFSFPIGERITITPRAELLFGWAQQFGNCGIVTIGDVPQICGVEFYGDPFF